MLLAISAHVRPGLRDGIVSDQSTPVPLPPLCSHLRLVRQARLAAADAVSIAVTPAAASDMVLADSSLAQDGTSEPSRLAAREETSVFSCRNSPPSRTLQCLPRCLLSSHPQAPLPLWSRMPRDSQRTCLRTLPRLRHPRGPFKRSASSSKIPMPPCSWALTRYAIAP